MRVDKLTLAALEATLRATRTPTWTYLRAASDELRERAQRLAAELAGIDVSVVPSDGVVGGGGGPGVVLPGWALALPESYARPLRTGEPAVVGRIEGGRCLLDLRCIPTAADADLIRAIVSSSDPTRSETSLETGLRQSSGR
jgi:L-seryl-tRNA(Ser) seleniumtransferase